MLKDFLATYKNQDISYTFITEPISRDINALIEMKQKHVDYLQLEIFSMNIFDTLKSLKYSEKLNSFLKMAIDICADHPSAFGIEKHIVTLPYEDDFSKKISLPNLALVDEYRIGIDKAFQITMSHDLVKTIKERVKSLPCLTLANPRLAKDCRDGRCLISGMEKMEPSSKNMRRSP
ncbi:hypothetical protein H5410_057583 [Solanum commersonii]|uniref:Uncharacterized protein n=1 Tax=Solanum commersonii TaxID=4109 RepID=A0A9J5WNH4_SOLCO|nr:hypothetical protein H5410_057583 [Solanum commersonii]